MSGEPICFECDAKDGLRVRLTQDRWDNHIRLLDGHPELEWHFAYPKPEIQKALELAEEISPGNKPNTRLYLGPPVVPDGTRYAAMVGRPPSRQFGWSLSSKEITGGLF